MIIYSWISASFFCFHENDIIFPVGLKWKFLTRKNKKIFHPCGNNKINFFSTLFLFTFLCLLLCHAKKYEESHLLYKIKINFLSSHRFTVIALYCWIFPKLQLLFYRCHNVEEFLSSCILYKCALFLYNEWSSWGGFEVKLRYSVVCFFVCFVVYFSWAKKYSLVLEFWGWSDVEYAFLG